MLTLQGLIDSTRTIRNKVNPTGPFILTKIAPVPVADVIALQARFRALTDSKTRRNHDASVVFHEVAFSDSRTNSQTKSIEISRNITKWYQPPSMSKNPVAVRCTCSDMYYMWWFWNNGEGAWAGPELDPYTRVPGSTRGPVNPEKASGLCKHLLRFLRYLVQNGFLTR